MFNSIIKLSSLSYIMMINIKNILIEYKNYIHVYFSAVMQCVF
jgi:hypothetical protein